VVEIKLDKVRNLHFDNEHIRIAERRTGLGFLDMCLALQKLPSLTVASGLLWAGLLHEDPKLTFETVDHWLKPKKLPYIWGKLIEAMNPYMGEDEDTPSPLADIPGANSDPSPESTSG
jgi:hypothetical protein